MTASNKAASVVFKGVSKVYGKTVRAVNDVSFTVEPGSLVTLLGPSGCGKTTTLRLVAGLEMATSGKIFIDGEDVSTAPATDRDVSMVFQSYALFPHMTVVENVAYGLTVSGTAKALAHEQAEQALAQIDLKGYGTRLPSELSGGQQQRVAVARALVLEPKVLLFDEPLSNLDAKLRRRVREDIRDLQQDLNLTTIYVTHDQEEALAVSDKIIVMRNAEIAQEGDPEALYERPYDKFVADFIGDANLVKGEIIKVDGDEAVVKIAGLERRMPSLGLKPGEADVAIRPISIHFGPQAAGPEAIAAKISKATYLGSHLEYRITTELGDLFVIDHDVKALVPENTEGSISLRDHGVALVRP